ncbi:PepSY domain-containing protein [Poseidonibacter lekithochrous]|uniref:PepSY domain-containing protein n=1 Tax=Poseidonibacter lekithochrous TaxID=1904463 RepID=UPI000D3933D4|nr:PepSY domain-containing protein [Poseidonibacter lekithochrous]
MNWKKVNTKIHYWGSAVIIIPLLIVLGSGLLLQVKKEFAWIQPKTMKTKYRDLTLTFDKILEVSKTVEEAKINSWKDVKLLDVRPGKGITKVRAKNNWEIQIHNESAEVLAVNFRRSDIIESIHDGSWFHDAAKLWIFLPSAVILLLLSLTGFYLFLKLLPSKMKKRKHKLSNKN